MYSVLRCEVFKVNKCIEIFPVEKPRQDWITSLKRLTEHQPLASQTVRNFRANFHAFLVTQLGYIPSPPILFLHCPTLLCVLTNHKVARHIISQNFPIYLFFLRLNTGLFVIPSGTSELDCATTKKDRAERNISIGRESLKVFFCTRDLGVLAGSTARG